MSPLTNLVVHKGVYVCVVEMGGGGRGGGGPKTQPPFVEQSPVLPSRIHITEPFQVCKKIPKTKPLFDSEENRDLHSYLFKILNWSQNPHNGAIRCLLCAHKNRGFNPH